MNTSAREVREMVEQLSYKGTERSIFGLDHWGAKDESLWLQPDFKNELADKFIHSKVKGYKSRLLEATIDLLIERRFFKEPRTTKEVTLAVEIIHQFLDTSTFQKACKMLKKVEAIT